ncbi:hypothetical protein BsWGS_27410 [Bradybaena similaris]
MMEKLDLNSIEKTELLVSNAAKDKILIKPKRTSTRQAARKQDSARPSCLPKLVEEMKPTAATLTGNQQPGPRGGRSGEKVTFSHDKPTPASDQPAVDTSPDSKLRLPVFTATVRGSKGDRGLAAPTSPASAATTITTTTTTPAPLPTVASPTSPSTRFLPSCKTVAASIPSTVFPSSQLTASCTPSASKVWSTTRQNEANLAAAALVSGQVDSQKTVAEAKAEINIKSMMNRFQPPASNKSSPSRSVTATLLETDAASAREEGHTRQFASDRILSSVRDDKLADSSVTSPSSTTAKTPVRGPTILEHTHAASVDSSAASTPAASWVRKKKEFFIGDESNKSASAANSMIGANVSVSKPGVAANSLAGANISVLQPGTTFNSVANSSASKSSTTFNSVANSSVTKSSTTFNSVANSSVTKSSTTFNSVANISVSKPGATANSVTGADSSVSKSATVCLGSTQDSTQRLSSRWSDHPSRKISSGRLESTCQTLQKHGTGLTSDETDSTNLDSAQTAGSQENSVRASRSLFDSSTHLNTKTNGHTVTTSTTSPHLKSTPTSQTASPGSRGQEADRKPSTADDEDSRKQRPTGLSTFYNKAAHGLASAPVSVSSLPSSSVSNKARTVIVTSVPDNSGTSSGSVTSAAKQPSCIQPSLAAPFKNTAHWASPAKPVQPSSIAAAAMSTDAPRLPAGQSRCAVLASAAAGHEAARLPGIIPSLGSSRVAPSASSNLASAATSTSSSGAICPPWKKSSSAQVHSPQVPATAPPTKQTTSPTQALPGTQTTPGNKPLTFQAAIKPADKSIERSVDRSVDRSIAGENKQEDKPTDAGVKVPPWRANQLKKDVKVEIVDRKGCNQGAILQPSKVLLHNSCGGCSS